MNTIVCYLCLFVPNTLTVDTQHVSHISQHFGPNPTNYGYQDLVLMARWDFGTFHVELGEGYNFVPRDGQVCAGLCGPREMTVVNIGYTFRLR